MSSWLPRKELYHVALVHLVVALPLLWMVFETLLTVWRKRRRDWDGVFVVLAVLGAVAAFGANLTGEIAEHLHQERGLDITPIQHHAEVALFIVWFFLALLAIAALTLFFPWEGLRILRFGVACGLLIVMLIAARRGGRLVYDYGFAVQKLPTQGESTYGREH